MPSLVNGFHMGISGFWYIQCDCRNGICCWEFHSLRSWKHSSHEFLGRVTHHIWQWVMSYWSAVFLLFCRGLRGGRSWIWINGHKFLRSTTQCIYIYILYCVYVYERQKKKIYIYYMCVCVHIHDAQQNVGFEANFLAKQSIGLQLDTQFSRADR